MKIKGKKMKIEQEGKEKNRKQKQKGGTPYSVSITHIKGHILLLQVSLNYFSPNNFRSTVLFCSFFDLLKLLSRLKALDSDIQPN